MKKVRILITKGDWAGAQRVVYEIAKYIKLNYSDTLELDVAIGIKGPLNEELKSIGVRVIELNNLIWEVSLSSDTKAVREIRRLIEENQYDVVHVHSTKAAFVGRIAARKANVKNIIYTVHGWWGIERFSGIKRYMVSRLEKYCAGFTDHMVFICKRDMSFALKNKIGPSGAYNLILNDVSIDSTVEPSLRKTFGISDKTTVIGNIGRLDDTKQPQAFVDIAQEVLKKNKDYFFVWIGSGLVKPVIEPQYKNKIKFVGFMKNPYPYLRDFDLLLMTSKYEGMPITIIEALKYNIPVLSSNVGGITEYLPSKNLYMNSNEAIGKILKKNYEKNIVYSDPDMAKKYAELYLNG